jgi:gentisate 1,2-dioxygenase
VLCPAPARLCLGLRFVNPATGASLFPTLDYGVQLLRPSEATRFKRETASTLYIAIEGEGVTEVARQRFEWRANDIFVVPGFAWRRHANAGSMDAILYTVSDAPLLDKIGQYRAQGRLPDDTVSELVP